jgi:type I restriction enzyme M protein
MARKQKVEVQLTTAQRLGSVVKSARDIMRKDKGLNGDLDRLPMLTWIMFLKFLDDNDEAVRPDGKRGPGLFAYLRCLQGANGGDRRDVIATVFKGTVNRMQSGYLLRDVLNKINGIHFTSSEEIHTLGHLYESLLKEMRDAAGDSGEFYTPRPLVRFIVTVVDPRLGETILDPAAGTGGFLVEAFEHLKAQCKKTEDHRQLQRGSILGVEAKPLPYLLCQMNLLLHGLEFPEIDPLNALRHSLREIGDKEDNDRAWKVPVDQILASNCNLDIKNPNAKQDLEHLPPEQLVASILQKEQRIAEIMVHIARLLEKKP